MVFMFLKLWMDADPVEIEIHHEELKNLKEKKGDIVNRITELEEERQENMEEAVDS
jgi:hypothetical protein